MKVNYHDDPGIPFEEVRFCVAFEGLPYSCGKFPPVEPTSFLTKKMVRIFMEGYVDLNVSLSEDEDGNQIACFLNPSGSNVAVIKALCQPGFPAWKGEVKTTELLSLLP